MIVHPEQVIDGNDVSIFYGTDGVEWRELKGFYAYDWMLSHGIKEHTPATQQFPDCVKLNRKVELKLSMLPDRSELDDQIFFPLENLEIETFWISIRLFIRKVAGTEYYSYRNSRYILLNRSEALSNMNETIYEYALMSQKVPILDRPGGQSLQPPF